VSQRSSDLLYQDHVKLPGEIGVWYAITTFWREKSALSAYQIFIWIRQKPIHTDTYTHTQNTIYNKRRNYETV